MTRDQFLRALRKHCRKSGIPFSVDQTKGKGSHFVVTVSERWTTVQSDLDPHKCRTILKQLGIDPAAFFGTL